MHSKARFKNSRPTTKPPTKRKPRARKPAKKIEPKPASEPKTAPPTSAPPPSNCPLVAPRPVVAPVDLNVALFDVSSRKCRISEKQMLRANRGAFLSRRVARRADKQIYTIHSRANNDRKCQRAF